MTGQVLRALLPPRLDGRELVRNLHRMGNRSLPIVTLTAFFAGGLMVVQSAPFVKRLGATSLAGWAAGYAVLREIGPILIGPRLSAHIVNPSITSRGVARRASAGAGPYPKARGAVAPASPLSSASTRCASTGVPASVRHASPAFTSATRRGVAPPTVSVSRVTALATTRSAPRSTWGVTSASNTLRGATNTPGVPSSDANTPPPGAAAHQLRMKQAQHQDLHRRAFPTLGHGTVKSSADRGSGAGREDRLSPCRPIGSRTASD